MLRSLYLVLAVDKYYKARMVVMELAKEHAMETLLGRYAYLEDFLLKMNTNYPQHLKAVATCAEMKTEYKQMKTLYTRLKDIGL